MVEDKGSNGCLTDTGMIRDTYLMELGPQIREMVLDSLHMKSNDGNLNPAGGDDFRSKNGELDNLKHTREENFKIGSETSFCVSYRKRKRKCNQRMLNWVLEVAKDPSNMEVEPAPESTKWKSYGSEQIWKQVLLARENMILKRDDDLSNAIWRTKQKMHPSMYDDYTGSQSLRSSERLVHVKKRQLLISKSPISLPNVSSSSGSEHQSVRVGPLYQANVPEHTEDTYVSDSKWLGSCVWPLEKGQSNKCHETKTTRNGGKVRDICKCRTPGSDKCVSYHIGLKRKRLKLELGPVFDYWEFDKMGQQVSNTWTKEDEKRFQVIVESNSHSTGEVFWDEMFKSFPRKSRKDLVSYYFNVFVLRRRALQNRSIRKEIDSDGEESEYGPLSNGFGRIAANSPTSIFHSPKKAYLEAP